MGFSDILELVLTCLYLGICITSFIWRLTKEDKKKMFIEFEIWSLIGQLAYYIIFLINGFSNLLSKEREGENKCQKFLKSIIFKYLWPFVMSSFAVFYLGHTFDWFYIPEDKDNDYVLSIFLHGLSQAGFLIDIILFRREYKPTHIFDFLVISGIYICYSILFYSIKPKVSSYHFISVNDESNSFIISLIIMCYFVYLYMYMLYMFIVKVKFSLFGVEKEGKIIEKYKKEDKLENKKEIKPEPLMDTKNEEEEKNELKEKTESEENKEISQGENNQENQ